MNIKQLTLIFEVYGSQPEGWPIDKVEEIYDLLKTNSDAISLKKEFDEMDQVLNELYLPDFDNLTELILDRQLPERNSNLATDFLNWLWPINPSIRFFWRPISAASLPLLFGIFLSNYFSFGINYKSSDSEYWIEELTLMALIDDYEGDL